jgi:uncharacterized membrane protein YeaQ/YmgE (transglycosylase-associated protein family)
MGILIWIIFGGLVGWIASIVMGTNKNMGLIANVAVGVVGAFIGGFIMQYFDKTGVTGFNVRSFLVALLGAVILLGIMKLIIKND